MNGALRRRTVASARLDFARVRRCLPVAVLRVLRATCRRLIGRAVARSVATFFLSAPGMLVGQHAMAAERIQTCDGVQVIGNEMSQSEAEAYCRYAVQERQKVESFWGSTWREPIRIHVNSEFRISRALVPGHFGDRGLLEMPLSRARRNTGALLHEIVHIYAPHENRFLAEGLAVYLHAKLAANGAFPNFGGDLHGLAARNAQAVASLEALNAVRTPSPLGKVADERTAYILAGAFVGFLIERYGLGQFRSLYESEKYAEVYGKPFAVLEGEWRASLNR